MTAAVYRPRILVLQGANMAALGVRQPEFYGTTTAAELDAMVRDHAIGHGYDIDIFYTHHEGEAIARLYRALAESVDALVMNPAGFLCAGQALADCLRSLPFPVVEVHMTNIEKRGRRSVTVEAARGMIAGLGTDSYMVGLDAALKLIADKNPNGGKP